MFWNAPSEIIGMIVVRHKINARYFKYEPPDILLNQHLGRPVSNASGIDIKKLIRKIRQLDNGNADLHHYAPSKTTQYDRTLEPFLRTQCVRARHESRDCRKATERHLTRWPRHRTRGHALVRATPFGLDP